MDFIVFALIQELVHAFGVPVGLYVHCMGVCRIFESVLGVSQGIANIIVSFLSALQTSRCIQKLDK